MKKEAISYIEKNYEDFNEIAFSKKLNIKQLGVAKRTFKEAIKEIANKDLRKGKNVNLIKWARAIKKSDFLVS